MMQEVMGWHWHQLDHMQVICTLLQIDNYTSTSSLNFYGPDALPATNSVKVPKAKPVRLFNEVARYRSEQTHALF